MKARRVLLGAAVALGALAGAAPTAAWAHPLLIQATPQPGLVADAAPPAIGLALTEPAVARGSRIRLFGADGAVLPVTPVRAGNGRRALSVRPRARLRSAVYTVRWSVLGDDGHIVSGAFDFGVAGAKGAAPPGVERLSGGGAGRGGETAAADGAVRVLSRWLGILAASVLFGGFVLVALLRRRLGRCDDAGVAVLRRLAPAAWLLVVVAAVEGIVAGASSGTGGAPDLGLLTASATGVSELARAIVVAAVSLALLL
ncbi:MAG: copper transport protein, partial [Solirubrobacteraceae bacterium]|nr:copper transport protein [Solirubrobacteraceae bacterium]